jgi:hypothetical protein
MKKYLVTIDFKYTIKAKNEDDTDRYKTKKITVGIFEDFDLAISQGNEVLKILENHFKIHKFPNGTDASKERFGKNSGCFGYPKTLVTNLAYLKTPFAFYANIETLNCENVEETILSVLEDLKP